MHIRSHNRRCSHYKSNSISCLLTYLKIPRSRFFWRVNSCGRENNSQKQKRKVAWHSYNVIKYLWEKAAAGKTWVRFYFYGSRVCVSIQPILDWIWMDLSVQGISFNHVMYHNNHRWKPCVWGESIRNFRQQWCKRACNQKGRQFSPWTARII